MTGVSQTSGAAGQAGAVDVFVSYAHADDKTPFGASHGWVTTLIGELRIVLGRRRGRDDAAIWMDHQLAANDSVTDTLMQRVSASRTLVLVLSPGYLKSSWCQCELAGFVARARAQGRVDCVFPIELEPIERERLPAAMSELTPLPFWDQPHPNGVPRLAGYPLPKPDEDSLYWQQVNHLAHLLSEHLDKMPAQPLPISQLPPLVAPATPTPAPALQPLAAASQTSPPLTTATAAPPAAPNGRGTEPLDLSIYLHSAPEDQANAELIADHLATLGVSVLMTPEPEPGKTYLDCLRENRELLQACQGFVMVRGQSPANNLMVAYQLAQQSFGVRRRDVWAAAVNLPPPGRASVPIRSPNLAQVDCTGGFQAEALLPFLGQLAAQQAQQAVQTAQAVQAAPEGGSHV
jgi:hypothetical protein